MVLEAKRIRDWEIGYFLGEIEDAEDVLPGDWAEFWGSDDLKQLEDYVVGLGAGYAVLTTGGLWAIFDLKSNRDIKENRVAYLNILSGTLEEKRRIRMLRRENVLKLAK